MLASIATNVTAGFVFPDGGTSHPADVIFQTAEDGLADTIKPRLERMGADCSKIHAIDDDDKALSLADERIEQAIVKTKAKLLVLDPLQAFLGGANINAASGIREQMKKLAGVAERTGCAVVIIGHLNKGKGQKSQYRGLGSIDIVAAARSVLTVGRLDSGQNMRAFIQTKSNLAPTGEPQAFELDHIFGLVWHGKCDITIDDLLNCNQLKLSRSKMPSEP